MKPRTLRSPRRLTAGVFVAAVAVVAIPATADAAVTPAVTGTHLTLTGDDSADNIALADNAAGLLTHNFSGGGLADDTDFDPSPHETKTLPADGTVDVAVNAGGGSDTINLSRSNLASTTIDGDDGDDIIVGTAAADVINGSDGSDRITGFRGGDTINGDAGNDVMIWNNGDGSDTNDGGTGNDETLVTTGTADDAMTVIADGARTKFIRTSPGPFSIDMGTVEKLTITSFSGDDGLETAAGVTLAMNIDAGPGNDAIITGDAADLLQGGDGDDTLTGGGGGDRIVGNRGGDTMNGGAGEDTMVWNNGDGSDVMNGEAGVDRTEVNLSGAGDTSTLKVEQGRVRYDRLNPGPFNLSIGSAEIFELNTLGGNDTLTTEPGVPIAVVADGGEGDDTFTGGDEPDTFFGGSGDDRLDPGLGNDVADGGDGNDALTIRDGAGDLGRGGAGFDTAIADAMTVDAVAADVETIAWTALPAIPNSPAIPKPPAAEKPAGAAKLRWAKTVKRNRARVAISCPAGTTGCEGVATLMTARKVNARGVRARLELARKSWDLQPGQRRTLSVRLPKGAKRLARRNKLTLHAVAKHDGGRERTAKVTLRLR
jgi:Ca2+-binding RTX toxin-like protein